MSTSRFLMYGHIDTYINNVIFYLINMGIFYEEKIENNYILIHYINLLCYSLYSSSNTMKTYDVNLGASRLQLLSILTWFCKIFHVFFEGFADPKQQKKCNTHLIYFVGARHISVRVIIEKGIVHDSMKSHIKSSAWL